MRRGTPRKCGTIRKPAARGKDAAGANFLSPVTPLPSSPMLHYFKFRHDLLAPQPAREVDVRRGAGKGWPGERPPIRAANGFGFDLLANFDVSFVRSRATDSGWRVEPDVVIH